MSAEATARLAVFFLGGSIALVAIFIARIEREREVELYLFAEALEASQAALTGLDIALYTRERQLQDLIAASL